MSNRRIQISQHLFVGEHQEDGNDYAIYTARDLEAPLITGEEARCLLDADDLRMLRHKTTNEGAHSRVVDSFESWAKPFLYAMERSAPSWMPGQEDDRPVSQLDIDESQDIELWDYRTTGDVALFGFCYILHAQTWLVLYDRCLDRGVLLTPLEFNILVRQVYGCNPATNASFF